MKKPKILKPLDVSFDKAMEILINTKKIKKDIKPKKNTNTVKNKKYK